MKTGQNWEVSFLPSGEWFVFDQDTNQTLATGFKSKRAAILHGQLHIGLMG